MQKERSIPTDFHHLFWQDKEALTDSRQIQLKDKMVFFALSGPNHDGQAYVGDLYKRGIRYFVVRKNFDSSPYPKALFLKTDQPLKALQNWAKAHREQHQLHVIGISGSNGKTIVKEYLYQLLHKDWVVVKSPKSYNSQLGVPLSVLQIQDKHQIGIFEAGISKTEEMQHLAPIIQAQIGIFTNIGAAHAAGFKHIQEKIEEKLKLFQNSKVLIYCKDHQQIDQLIQKHYPDKELWSWGQSTEARIQIQWVEDLQNQSQYNIQWQGQQEKLLFPFRDAASIENAMHCVTAMLALDYSIEKIQLALKGLSNIPMRLEWKEGIDSCMLIDDSYNNDLVGLRIALDFMQTKLQQTADKNRKSLILSDIAESSMDEAVCYQQVAQMLKSHGIQKFIGIGAALERQEKYFQELEEAYFYKDTASCLQAIGKYLHFQNETILLKGARAFEFEQLVRRLRRRSHQTQLEFDLQALAQNYSCYRQQLKKSTKIMVMVKAFAYGSSSYEIARLLEVKGVDYLGVAYADEGVQLRLEGIQLPIMVMNTNPDDFQDLIDYDLEPAVYSLSLLKALNEFVEDKVLKRPLKLQIELDTGMHRLGFDAEELEQILHLIQHPNLEIRAVFSHLAAADEDLHEDFSKEQIQKFKGFANQLEEALGKPLLKHMLNSAGISRFKDAQFDMVRLGIGLHGIDPNARVKGLKAVARLKTVVSQVKKVSAGASVGYSRASISTTDRQIATLAIGYADGLMRAFSQGVGKVWIKGQLCPIVGNICMDMCFVDVTGLKVKEGDEAEIFGKMISVNELAEAIHSIPYEILTNISRRVPRVFFEA
jgi:alanine racemase